MKKPSWYVSRRTLLQTAGVAIGLPALEAMILPGARAGTTPPPRRFLAFHGQIYGYVGRHDAELDLDVAPWTSQAPGYEVALESNSYLKPFFDRGINSKISVLTGISDPVMIGTHDSPVKMVANTYPIAMYRGGCVVHTPGPGDTSTVGPPPQPDPFDGATADQIAAMALGAGTAIPSLTMSVEAIGGDYYTYAMSNKNRNEPIPSIMDPLEAFNRLFAGYDPSATIDEIERRARYRKSVLDGVREDAKRLRARLGRSDQTKLDGYLDSVRALELQIDQTTTQIPQEVIPPGDRGSYATNELVQHAMQDLIVNAFITDRTRVVAFSGAYGGSWLRYRGSGQEGMDYSQYREFNGQQFNESQHTMSHYDQGLDGGAPSEAVTAQKKDWMDIFTHWSLEMYSELLAKLDGYTDSDGQSTVLDNTMAIYAGDDSDSARHGYTSMPCIVGGRGGASDAGWRIKSGRQLRFGAGGTSVRTWKDLLWGAMNIVGVPDPDGSSTLQSFGYADKALDEELGS